MAGIHRPDWPVPDNVKAFFTTREGGVSRGPYRSFNLGMHVGDQQSCTQHNRGLLPRAERIYWLQQVHGVHCVSLDEALPVNPQADASTTTLPGYVCAVMTADCLPVLLCDKQGSRVAAVHAGWRGLATGVIERALSCFSDASEVLAWLGPAISQNHFEVGQDVVDALKPALLSSLHQKTGLDNKYCFDLYGAAKTVLQESGVVHIWGGEYCTYSQSELFFSHRRSTHQGEAATGRMVSGIYLVP